MLHESPLIDGPCTSLLHERIAGLVRLADLATPHAVERDAMDPDRPAQGAWLTAAEVLHGIRAALADLTATGDVPDPCDCWACRPCRRGDMRYADHHHQPDE